MKPIPETLTPQQLFEIIEHLPYATGVFDAEFRYLYFNAAGEAMSGQALDKVLNKKPSEILPPEVYNTFVPVLQAAKQSKETQTKLIELDFGSGPIILKLVYVPLLNASGEVERILGITEDKTKEMFNESQLNMTAELVKVGGWRQQLPNRDVWMSKELLNMFGYPTDYKPNADELRGRFPDILDLRKVIESSIADEVPWDEEVRYVTLRGEQRWARYTGRPEYRDGKPCAIYGAMIDITSTKLIRNELALTLQQAQRASQVKSEFLANMSHELRTPLTTIAGYVELLMESDFSPAEQREYFGRIKKSITQTTRIIGDILDFERIEAQKFELSKEKVAFRNLMHDFKDFLMVNTMKKNLNMTFEVKSQVPQAVFVDFGKLKQIYCNIVENAVKFTSKGSIDVAVACRAAGSDKCLLQVLIKDTGIGIHPSKKDAIFEIFTQADNSLTRQYGGTGLGLTLSRKLAQAMAGNVRLLESMPGTGSTFEILVSMDHPPEIQETLAPLNAQPTPATNQTQGIFAGRKFLLAEDVADNSFIFTEILKRMGASVDTAANGKLAVEQALKAVYDVILMDLQMPVVDGYQAAEMLRKAMYKKPIVALTAYATGDDRQKCLRSGFDGFLTKPLERKNLEHVIGKILKEADALS